VDVGAEVYILAEGLLEEVMKKFGIKKYDVLEKISRKKIRRIQMPASLPRRIR